MKLRSLAASPRRAATQEISQPQRGWLRPPLQRRPERDAGKRFGRTIIRNDIHLALVSPKKLVVTFRSSIFFSVRPSSAFTLIEVLAVLALFAVFAAILVPRMARVKGGPGPAHCVNNLKQVGLAFRTWEGDYSDRYPMTVPDAEGGARESCSSGNSCRAFQVMSNELNNPKILTCPQDPTVRVALNCGIVLGSNISFLLGVDADENYPTRILSGDRNILSDVHAANGILNLTASRSVKWAPGRHKGVGNVLLADGSVQQLTPQQLNTLLTNTGLATNRIALP